MTMTRAGRIGLSSSFEEAGGGEREGRVSSDATRYDERTY